MKKLIGNFKHAYHKVWEEMASNYNASKRLDFNDMKVEMIIGRKRTGRK